MNSTSDRKPAAVRASALTVQVGSVNANRLEKVRKEVDALCWAGIGMGLAFTMTNVQQFAAAGATAWSLSWMAAWLLDPTVSLVLLAILRAEQITSRYRIATGRWVRRAKWFTLAATYIMNTWSSFAVGSVAGVVLHSVPPILVFVAAEAITDLRDKLTDAIAIAHAQVDSASTVDQAKSVSIPVSPLRSKTTSVDSTTRRTSSTEYLQRARAAWTPGIEVTPAWIRKTTNCSRGLSSKLAAQLNSEISDARMIVDQGGEHG